MLHQSALPTYDGQIGQAAPSASKGGIVDMTLPIARDLARNGIRNMTIAPVIFGTPMLFGMPYEVQDALAAGYRSRAGSAPPPTTPSWCRRSSPTRCSMAK